MIRLGLSSQVAPEANLEDLVRACERRGLTALELDGTSDAGLPRGSAAGGEHAGEEARGDDGRTAVVGVRTDSGSSANEPAALAARLAVPLLVDGEGGLHARLEEVRRLRRAGADARLVIRGPTAVDEAEYALRKGAQLAWDVAPSETDLSWDLPRLEPCLGRGLDYIRLLGGGPESAMQEGLGVGVLMGRLGLAGFQGPLILAPSSHRYRLAWERWLGRRGGWGCGGTASDPVALGVASSQTREVR